MLDPGYKYVVFDYESEAIEPRPKYPPRPVGLALYLPQQDRKAYWAWGHDSQNNCDERDAQEQVSTLIADPTTFWIAHNLAFDASIMEEKWHVKFPWDRCADTMLLAFLHNPYGQLSLKPLCEELLGMPPEEQEAVRGWLIAHGLVRANDKGWGANIARARGDLVGAYAIGDVVRAWELFNFYCSPEAQKISGSGDPRYNNRPFANDNIGHNKSPSWNKPEVHGDGS
jgi:3'-5' exonuclease